MERGEAWEGGQGELGMEEIPLPAAFSDPAASTPHSCSAHNPPGDMLGISQPPPSPPRQQPLGP